jgi:hypothetical protein
MKKVFFMLLAMMLVTQVTFAQKEGTKRTQPNPELKKEMRTYIEKNVQPVLLKAQNEFDAQLNKEDLAFIKEKRAEITQRQEEMKANRQKVRTLREEGKTKEEIHEALGIDPEAKKEGRQASKAEMKGFMERNKETIGKTMETLKPSYKTWIEEEKAIVQKYRPEGDKPERAEGEKKRRSHGPRIGLFGITPPKAFGPHPGRKGKKMKGEKSRDSHRKGERKHDRGEKRMDHKGGHGEHGENAKKGDGAHGKRSRLAVEFILWDGNLPPERAQNEGFETLSRENSAKAFSLQNYPNPANGITKISADLPGNSKVVKITINDRSGKVVKSLNFKNLDKGVNEFTVDVSNLPDGLYFYTFEADGVKATKRMIVGK